MKFQISGRIIRISQQWVRPIVRGKTNASVEFGPKAAISPVDGYAQFDKLDWDGYNKGNTLIESSSDTKLKENITQPESWQTRSIELEAI